MEMAIHPKLSSIIPVASAITKTRIPLTKKHGSAAFRNENKDGIFIIQLLLKTFLCGLSRKIKQNVCLPATKNHQVITLKHHI
jgi:hypothetical protein